jgi:hypothetical protein
MTPGINRYADRIELYHFGRGHTDGDAWVVFPSARALYVDIFPGPELPLLDPRLERAQSQCRPLSNAGSRC